MIEFDKRVFLWSRFQVDTNNFVIMSQKDFFFFWLIKTFVFACIGLSKTGNWGGKHKCSLSLFLPRPHWPFFIPLNSIYLFLPLLFIFHGLLLILFSYFDFAYLLVFLRCHSLRETLTDFMSFMAS